MTKATVRVLYRNNWKTVEVNVPDYFNFPSSRLDHIDAVYEWLRGYFRDRASVERYTGNPLIPTPNMFYLMKLDNKSVFSI